jgi:hypothetical protein
MPDGRAAIPTQHREEPEQMHQDSYRPDLRIARPATLYGLRRHQHGSYTGDTPARKRGVCNAAATPRSSPREARANVNAGAGLDRHRLLLLARCETTRRAIATRISREHPAEPRLVLPPWRTTDVRAKRPRPPRGRSRRSSSSARPWALPCIRCRRASCPHHRQPRNARNRDSDEPLRSPLRRGTPFGHPRLTKTAAGGAAQESSASTYGSKPRSGSAPTIYLHARWTARPVEAGGGSWSKGCVALVGVATQGRERTEGLASR